MLERIIVGIIIGLVAGYVLKKDTEDKNKINIVLAFIGIIAVAFIGSSFMFGATYGLMAIGEILIGYYLLNYFINQKKHNK